MIKIYASGNIGKDAEVKEFGENTVTSFSIASNKKIKGEDVTTWLNCKKWNAGNLSQYLTKGTKVIVSGDLEIREHEGKYYTSCIVFDLEFAGTKEQKETGNQVIEGANPSKKIPVDDIDENSDLPF